MKLNSSREIQYLQYATLFFCWMTRTTNSHIPHHILRFHFARQLIACRTFCQFDAIRWRRSFCYILWLIACHDAWWDLQKFPFWYRITHIHHTIWKGDDSISLNIALKYFVYVIWIKWIVRPFVMYVGVRIENAKSYGNFDLETL